MKTAITIASGFALLISATPAAKIDDAEQAMQARDFDSAVEILGGIAADDYSTYLRAVALYQSDKYSDATLTCEALLRDHPDSAWRHKARFLMARALIAQKDHQAAESILAAEAGRIFSPERKQAIAKVLVDFADHLARDPDPNELDALPADNGKSLALYQQVLALEVSRELRDDTQFKVALAHQRLGQHPQAIAVLHEYLGAFDPTWTGPVGSASRQRGDLKGRPAAAGSHTLEARYALIESQIATLASDSARQNVDALLPILGDRAMEFDDRRGGSDERTAADVAHLRVLTYANDLPNHIA
ncbi:MAG: tetratricopeptide repeat protein, partial [Verrucomicrobiales bacterium]